MKSVVEAKHRIEWIDTLKAIMIFFVLLGHTDGISKSLHHYIYSFHMEVFFFITGLIQKEKNYEIKYLPFIKKNFKSLMVPYFILGFATYLLWLLVSRNFGAAAKIDIHPLKPFIGMFYGQPGNHFLVHNFPLWFLPCLFMTHSIFYFIAKLKDRKLIIIFILLFGVIGCLYSKLSLRLPWGIDRSLIYMVYFGFGYLTSKSVLLERKINPIFALIIVVLGLLIHILLLALDSRSNIYLSYFLYYIIGCIGIVFWSFIAMQLPKLPIFARIGKNTMVIFILHDATFFFLTGIAVFILRLPISFKENSLTASITYSILTMMILLPISLLIKKYTPWVIGLPIRSFGGNK